MADTARTIAIVECELEGAQAWAQRSCVEIAWLPERLEIRATLRQRQSGETYHLVGQVSEYRELPPIWMFADSEWNTSNRLDLFPKGVQTKFGNSIFIQFTNGGVICAPFNRLAYKVHAGPHQDWVDATKWLSTGTEYVQATCLGEMLQAIYRDFSFTSERWVQ